MTNAGASRFHREPRIVLLEEAKRPLAASIAVLACAFTASCATGGPVGSDARRANAHHAGLGADSIENPLERNFIAGAVAPRGAVDVQRILPLRLNWANGANALAETKNDTDLKLVRVDPLANLIQTPFQSNFDFGGGELGDAASRYTLLQPVFRRARDPDGAQGGAERDDKD